MHHLVLTQTRGPLALLYKDALEEYTRLVRGLNQLNKRQLTPHPRIQGPFIPEDLIEDARRIRQRVRYYDRGFTIHEAARIAAANKETT